MLVQDDYYIQNIFRNTDGQEILAREIKKIEEIKKVDFLISKNYIS